MSEPKNPRKKMQGGAITLLVVCVVGGIIALLVLLGNLTRTVTLTRGEYQNFTSYDQVTAYAQKLQKNQAKVRSFLYAPNLSFRCSSAMPDAGNSQNGMYSKTNTQVESIDEPDTVKTDGRFLFSMVKDGEYFTKLISTNATDKTFKKLAFSNFYGENLLLTDSGLIAFGKIYPDKMVSFYWALR